MRVTNIINFIFFLAAIISQKITYDIRVINIEVPVRVFNDDRFVDQLTKNDFIIMEDGVPQNIEAAYLINKSNIERKLGESAYIPNTSRHFYLLFSLYEYNQKIPKALYYFFRNVLSPQDQLIIITPRKVYNFRKELMPNEEIEKIVDKITKIIRKDILTSDAAYRSILNDLKRMAGLSGIERMNKEMESWSDDGLTAYGSGSFDEYLQKYKSDVAILENLRIIDEEKMLEFAGSLKNITGRKIVHLFYQKEYVPLLPKNLLAEQNNNPILKSAISDLFELFNRRSSVNVERLKEAFSDSKISIYFSYLTKRSGDTYLNQIEEHSEDVYSVFNEIAKATGGNTISSSDPEYLIRQASKEVENYYLLYYSPKNKNMDMKFRKITVVVKRENCRVKNYAGYFAK